MRAWLLAVPLLVYLAVFLVYPMGEAVRLAFTDSVSGSFPSLASFRILADDRLFRDALVVNLLLPMVAVALEVVAGLGLALLLAERLPARRLLRAAVLLPFALPEIVFLTILRNVLTPRGYLNGAFAMVGVAPVDLLSPGTASSFVSVAFVDAWRTTPVVFLILLGALAALPAEIGQAARVDGASSWRRFWHVTLPLLRPALVAAILLRGLDALRLFAAPLVLTGVEGVPVLSTYAYHQWSDYGDDGAAAAASVVLALLCLLASAPLLRRRVTA
ncbi:MAG: sugar ABC transporter permease [Candidatus Binatia bacterium]|nr:sugar ABC transporter permease [Candidatus Binatia bacterium]